MEMDDSSSPAADFVDYLGPDTSATVFTMIHHPADLARASAVSRSWRQFVIDNHFTKLQCLRACPEVSTFTAVDVTTSRRTTLQDQDQHSAAQSNTTAEHFNSMRNSFGVSPQRSHYTLFLDMLGRAGRLTDAACTIEAMPIRPDVSMYRNLLAFCELHNDPVVAENIARKALELYPSDTVFQNTLSDISGAPWKHEHGVHAHRMKSDADVQAKA